ncbi:hypothetical protein CVD28_00515 [Bacillus sp. M6-12]|uniref:YwbE family protein n=1 Tax=Bacillus sp. M6-12 TaxID=2054166 RepID=UPI000C7889F5|nr:YwbE family protein [Bacillus sp. M6-12]PLS18917.1 hypothetical protein CVD28_00515 [Bacillus sp. M6-12]
MRGEYRPGQYRDELMYGLTVDIVLKEDQKTGKLTRGKIQDILTNKRYHPRGCKVRLMTDKDTESMTKEELEQLDKYELVGRVQDIIEFEPHNK